MNVLIAVIRKIENQKVHEAGPDPAAPAHRTMKHRDHSMTCAATLADARVDPREIPPSRVADGPCTDVRGRRGAPRTTRHSGVHTMCTRALVFSAEKEGFQH